jgi:hypothetical protein
VRWAIARAHCLIRIDESERIGSDLHNERRQGQIQNAEVKNHEDARI